MLSAYLFFFAILYSTKISNLVNRYNNNIGTFAFYINYDKNIESIKLPIYIPKYTQTSFYTHALFWVIEALKLSHDQTDTMCKHLFIHHSYLQYE